MRTRAVAKAQFAVFRRRSHEFAQAAATAAERGRWDVAVATAVHSAISQADALTVWYLGRRNASQAHGEAVALFRDLSIAIDTRELDRNGRHLSALLNLRDSAEYEERRLREADWRRAQDHLVKFREWAGQRLP